MTTAAAHTCLHGPRSTKVRARAADDQRVFVEGEADKIRLGPLHHAGDPGLGPLEAGHAPRADVLVAPIADVRRNVACERRGESCRRAGHSLT